MATLLWAYRNLPEFTTVFCDTGWEHETTYTHIKAIELALYIDIVRLKSEFDFVQLAKKKGRTPSTKARFCTEYLKVRPMIDFILSQNSDVTVYQGIRADESANRSKMKIKDEYFKGYFEPIGYTQKGKAKYHTYKAKQVKEYCEKYSVDVYRPIFLNSANEVFQQIKDFGLKPNPLYFDGFSRVGCFPCVMCNHNEIKIMIDRYPERLELLKSIEFELDSTFFPPNYIPEKFCSKVVVNSKGKTVRVPTIDDVLKYLKSNDATLFELPKCQSVYSICE